MDGPPPRPCCLQPTLVGRRRPTHTPQGRSLKPPPGGLAPGPLRRATPPLSLLLSLQLAVLAAWPPPSQATTVFGPHRWVAEGVADDEYRVLPPAGWEIIVRTSQPRTAEALSELNGRLLRDGPPQHMLDLCPGKRWAHRERGEPLLCRPQSALAAGWLLHANDRVVVVVRRRAERIFAGDRYVAVLEGGESLLIGDIEEQRWVRRLDPAEIRPRIAGPSKDARTLYQADIRVDRADDVLRLVVREVFGVRAPFEAPPEQQPTTRWGLRLADGVIVDVVTDPPGADVADPARRAQLIEQTLAATGDDLRRPLEKLVTEALLRPGPDVVPALLHGERSVDNKRTLPRQFLDAVIWCAGVERAELVARLWEETWPPGSAETVSEALEAPDALQILGALVIDRPPDTSHMTDMFEAIAGLRSPAAAALLGGIVRGRLREKPEDYIRTWRIGDSGWDASKRHLAALASMGPEAGPEVRAIVAERLSGWRMMLPWLAVHANAADVELLSGVANDVVADDDTHSDVGPSAAALWRAHAGPSAVLERLLEGEGAWSAPDWLDAVGPEAGTWVLSRLAARGEHDGSMSYLCREPRRAAIGPVVAALRRTPDPDPNQRGLGWVFECLTRGAPDLPTGAPPTDPAWDAFLEVPGE